MDQSIRIVFHIQLKCYVKYATVTNKDFLSLVPSHHRMHPDEYDDKPKQSHRSRSPMRVPRDRSEHSEPRKSTGEPQSISPPNKTCSYKSAWCSCVMS